MESVCIAVEKIALNGLLCGQRGKRIYHSHIARNKMTITEFHVSTLNYAGMDACKSS